jgi:hypothetical protein
LTFVCDVPLFLALKRHFGKLPRHRAQP